MKRYSIYGGDRGYDVEEDKNGFYMYYDEFTDFISARIRELEEQKFDTTTKDGIYEFNINSTIISELKRLLK